MPHQNVFSNSIWDHVSINNVAILFAVLLVASVLVNTLRAPRYPTTVPWVGYGPSWLAAIRNSFGGMKYSGAWLQEGYEKYSKQGQAFVLPASLGGTAEIIVPREQISWLVEQPDHVLDTHEAHYDQLNGSYSFVTPQILKDPYHEHIVHKHLPRSMNEIVLGIADEIPRILDDLLGLDTEKFFKCDILDLMMRGIPGITNRMLVGKPLCRNRDYISNMMGFTNDVIRGLVLFAVIPQALHPIIGPIAALAPKYHYWRTCRHTVPVIQKRLADMTRKEAGDPAYEKWSPPNDFITWGIRTSIADGRHDELEPKMLAMRLMPINFAAIHTTAMAGQAVLLDTLSADPSVIEGLREEALRVYTEEGNTWTRAGLSRMHRMDSAIRESQRHSAFALTFVHRKVVAKEGIVSPDGVHFEYGTVISAPWTPISNDKDLFDRADEFDAFRYSREREEYEAMDVAEREKVDVLKMRQNGMVTTSDRHLAFSHGRHACPGRFFVAAELKMMLGHLLIHYEVKPIAERPKPVWIGKNGIPPKVDLEVRRRKTIV